MVSQLFANKVAITDTRCSVSNPSFFDPSYQTEILWLMDVSGDFLPKRVPYLFWIKLITQTEIPKLIDTRADIHLRSAPRMRFAYKANVTHLRTRGGNLREPRGRR